MKKMLLALATLPFFAAPAVAGSTSHNNHASGSHGTHSEMKEGVHADATLNSMGDGMANVSHGPIPEIGWPSMTMDLPFLEGAEIGDVKEGQPVMMMLEKGADGMFGIKALVPK
ncbi:MAG: copper-binding protein [Alphaproteobacteria bacterium]|nr:copper-binding protein [Alphaproteobacteria bacterium]